MRSSVKLLSALLAAAMLLPSQAMAAELAPAAEPAALTAETPQTGYEVTFQAQHASVDVFYAKDYTKADETNVTNAVPRNSDTGEIDTSGDGQVNFRVTPDAGYEIVSVTADRNYKNLKGAEDTGVDGIYRLTKVTGPVTVTITAKETGSGGAEQPEEPSYTPVITGDQRVQGFYNDTAALKAELAGRCNSGAMSPDGGSLEIVQYNAKNGFAYAVSGVKGKLIAVDLNASLSGDKAAELGGTEYDIKSLVSADGFTYGDMTSVSVSPDGGTLAVAIQAEDYTANGIVALFTCGADGSLTLSGTVPVGVQPDMVTFTPDGKYILTANEGEPRLGYTAEGAVDPKGSVTVIDAATLAAKTVDFTAFDSADARQTLVAEGIVLKKDTLPSVDLEPEYIACDNDTAYITCQEANAIAVLDIAKGEFTGVYSVGFEDYSQVPIDLGNNDKTYAPHTYDDLKGIRMPDAVSLYQVNGTTYLITANEGDSRTWPVDTETDVNEIKSKTSPNGKTFEKKVTWFDASQYDGLESGVDYLFGGRSFSVLRVTESGLEEVYDSGSDFEAITAKHFPDNFNCSNDNIVLEDRSGKKGPEPEGTAVGTVNGRTYAFIALERIGGVMIYDVTDPAKATFVNYINSREFAADIQGDVSPEGLCFVPAAASRTGKPLLLAACEVSGTLAVYELTGKSSGGNSGSGGSGTPAPAEPVKSPFTDVSADSPYAGAIRWAAERGIAAGKTAATFDPSGACTRGQAVTFLWRAAGKPGVSSGAVFSDVAADAYCAQAVRWAASLGIVTGYADGNFRPNATVTREQMAAILFRFAKAQGLDTTQGGMAIREFQDFDQLSPYAAEAMTWAVNAGILQGDQNRLLPQSPCARGQIVTLLHRLLAD
ncbi:MAG: choice-of-anchor I family protein [Dysosmobacter sp.]|nr:choice-of-anchor I family protein [Dysosmobacter sp.]